MPYIIIVLSYAWYEKVSLLSQEILFEVSGIAAHANGSGYYYCKQSTVGINNVMFKVCTLMYK